MKKNYTTASCLILTAIGSIVSAADFDLGLDAAYSVGRVSSPQLREISGMIVSRVNENIIWVHNDSGSDAQIFAINFKGNQKASFRLVDVKARDWEDIAAGPGPEKNKSYIYVGDIGDNYGQWPFIRLYRFTEPKIQPGTEGIEGIIQDIDTLKFAFSDGPRDAEVLIIDPLTMDVIIITKREDRSRVYHCPWPYFTDKVNKLEYCCELPWKNATAGDISIDGQLIILRSYLFVTYWKRIPDKPLWNVFTTEPFIGNLVFEKQGESLALDAAGRGYFTISEGLEQNLHYFKFPDKPVKPSEREGK